MRRAYRANVVFLVSGRRFHAAVSFLLGKERAEAAIALHSILGNVLVGHVAVIIAVAV